jgi:DNA-directed RNA polymerase subunit E'/Rpb7
MYTVVTLPANQLTNEIYQNLKIKLIRDYEKRCFRNYGFIVKIFDISKYESLVIPAENPNVSAPFRIEYSCRVCIPLEKQIIVCRIEKMSELFLVLSNGPIYVVVTIDRKNENVFFVDNNNHLRYRVNDNSVLLKIGDFAKISIETKTFNNNDTKIKVLGFLQDVASEKDIEGFYEDMYHKDSSGELINYETHIKETTQQLKQSIDLETEIVDVKENYKDNDDDNEHMDEDSEIEEA